MRDDFDSATWNAADHVSGEAADASLDHELALLTAYLADELSPAEGAAVKRRLGSDAGFRLAAAPLLAAWSIPIAFADDTVAAAEYAGDATREELDRGWERFTRDERRAGWRRRAPLIRAAAIVVLVGGPLFAIAQGIVLRGARTATSGAVSIGSGAGANTLASETAGTDRALVLIPRADATSRIQQPVALRVDPQPIVEIGSAPTGATRPGGGAGASGVSAPSRAPRASDPGLPPDVLYDVTGVARLADGRIVIAEFARGLKFFSATGQHIETVNLTALGVRGVNSLWPYRGDSLLVVESAGGGMRGGLNLTTTSQPFVGMVVDARGRRGRTVDFDVMPLPPSTDGLTIFNGDFGRSGIQGVLDDGSVVLRGMVATRLEGRPGPRLGRSLYYRLNPDGTVGDTIATMVVQDREELPGVQPNGRPNSEAPLFPLRAPRAAIRGQRMYWTDGGRFDVAVFELVSPIPRRAVAPVVMRTVKTPVATTDSLRNAYINRLIATIERGQVVFPTLGPPTRDAWLARATRPSLPAVAAIFVDPGGNVWLEHYRITMPIPDWVPDTTDVPRFTVLSPSGRELGEVTMPTGFIVSAIGADWVLGTMEDAQGVLRVRLLRLSR